MKTFLPRLALAVLITPILLTGIANGQVESDGDRLYVKVNQNRDISGIPVELTDIQFSTSFGDVAIPLEKIDGVKMNIDAENSAVVAFKNGDLVTGRVTLDMIKLKTDWGQANVNTSSIEMISSDKNGRFYSDTADGKTNWRFSKTPPVPANQINRSPAVRN